MVILTIQSINFINLTCCNVWDECNYFAKIHFLISGEVCINKIYRQKNVTYLGADGVAGKNSNNVKNVNLFKSLQSSSSFQTWNFYVV